MTLAPGGLLSIFDRIYVINLPHRQDRRREMAAELGRLGLGLDHPAVTLFPASFPPDQGAFPSRGARGCFESHLGVHRAILADEVRRALILEDDAGFASDFAARSADLAPRLNRLDWDALFSVRPMDIEAGDEDLGGGLMRLSPDHGVQTTHFMGVSRAFSSCAVPYLQAMYDRPAGSPDGGPMHVDGGYCWLRQAHPEIVTLATESPLAVQRSSRSDIAELKFYDRLPGLRGLAGMARRMRG